MNSSRSGLRQARDQVVIDLVVPQCLAEFFERRVCIDGEHLNAGDLGKVAQVLRGDGVAVDGVMRSAGMNPTCAGSLEIWAALPDRTRHGQLRQRLWRSDGIYFV